MCGVVGYYPMLSSDLNVNQNKKAFELLFRESTVRGLHAFGIVQELDIFRTFNIEEVVEKFDPETPALAHARYCTSGDWRILENNQPLESEGIVLVFNGVINMGTKKEIEDGHNLGFGGGLKVDNDGMIFLECIRDRIMPEEFLYETDGSFAGLWAWPEDDTFYAGRNSRRPLWWVKWNEATWIASTRDIFLRAGFPEPTEFAPGVYNVQDL